MGPRRDGGPLVMSPLALGATGRGHLLRCVCFQAGVGEPSYCTERAAQLTSADMRLQKDSCQYWFLARILL